MAKTIILSILSLNIILLGINLVVDIKISKSLNSNLSILLTIKILFRQSKNCL